MESDKKVSIIQVPGLWKLFYYYGKILNLDYGNKPGLWKLFSTFHNPGSTVFLFAEMLILLKWTQSKIQKSEITLEIVKPDKVTPH